jgi:hypothetical protein
MDQAIRNKLRGVVTQCRKLLEDAVSQELQGKFGIYIAKRDAVEVENDARMTHLVTEEEQVARKDILGHFEHIKARGFKPKEALEQLIREIAYTHLNRFCAYRMMEARQVYIGDERFREAVSRGVNSKGVKFYLADHPDDLRLFETGKQDVAYRYFLDWLGGLLSEEVGVLFNPNDSANRLYPIQKVLDQVLALLNDEALAEIWTQDETIGWVYQYFTPKELRDQARKESTAPRNSYELAFRNQFFTPRYVVQFLTDNTLGRIWYEMRKGDTKLKDQCQYMVRRPNEIFLAEAQQPPTETAQARDDLSQEELLKQPVYIPHRPKKDPRELKILDPACGSGHFLLYCFDLLLTIYEEAYDDPDLGPSLKKEYPARADFKKAVPTLILDRNLHGIDIDLRATQIAALALWLRSQRAYQDLGLKKERPKITRSNIVCAEPMPGEKQMLKEFVRQLEPRLLGQLVEVVFDKMKLAGEAGSLLRIEDEIQDAVAETRRQWLAGPSLVQPTLFGEESPARQQQFDFSGITDIQFFEHAERQVVDSLRAYAEKAQDGEQLQRRLFTADAVQGFAFIDLCHKQFDVVLMNPPFGESPETVQQLLRFGYPNGYHDLALCFVDRAIEWLVPGGMVGPLMTRTGFFLSGAREWRTALLSKTTLAEFVDLGLDVLDTAMVQVAAYTIRIPAITSFGSWFARLIKVPHLDKEPRLRFALAHTRDAEYDTAVFQINCSRFKNLPGQSLGYWLSHQLLQKLGTMQTTKALGLDVRIGLQTSDDFRYLRNWWELNRSVSGWLPFAKGGEYRPYYDDINLCVDWRDRGRSYWSPINPRIGKPYSNIWMLGETIARYFGCGGLTYPRRTSKKFNPRLLPIGSAFADKGPIIRWHSRQLDLAFLAIAYSRVFEWVMTAQVGKEGVDTRAAAISYEAGVVLSTPLPTLSSETIEQLASIASKLVAAAAQPHSFDEVSHWFVKPLCSTHDTVSDVAEWRVRFAEEAIVTRLELEASVEIIANGAYGLTGEDSAELDDALLPLPTSYPKHVNSDQGKEFENSYLQGASTFYRRGDEAEDVSARGRFHADDLEGTSHLLQIHPRSLLGLRQGKRMLRPGDLLGAAASIVSWAVGVSFGRWNIEAIQDNRGAFLTYELLLQSVPRDSPGMFQGPDGLQEPKPPEDYPLRIEWNGILVDDYEHQDDIVTRVREVLELIWKDRAEAVERESCEIFGVQELRDYFRKPGKGGFWDDHLSRYSKSRRKAPIYWLLQSPKKNYALWLYYHRLDKDLLFKALVNYVEPKIQRETNRLEEMRRQKQAAGESGKGAKKLGKEIERQEDLMSELREFEDELRRTANLRLEPDFNDGVVLNIAPLHELVPWKEAKNYWDELLEGEYEWSSIGKQLRQKGL